MLFDNVICVGIVYQVWYQVLLYRYVIYFVVLYCELHFLSWESSVFCSTHCCLRLAIISGACRPHVRIVILRAETFGNANFLQLGDDVHRINDSITAHEGSAAKDGAKRETTRHDFLWN